MKTSHIIYKVSNLDEAVQQFRNEGYEVEYGRDKNPINALIYFSEGPYIELLASTGMPKVAKVIFRLLGKGNVMNRLDYWDNHSGGCCGLALENYKDNLDEELNFLKENNQKSFSMKARRNDTKGRELRFITSFPYEIQLPFMMTYFNVDPKPKNFIHPNGAIQIKRIVFKTKKDLIPLVNKLCDDEILEISEGSDLGIEIETEKGILKL